MENANIEITVGIVTYNRSQSLKNCLQSVIRQNFLSIEILVSDDNSSDDTFKIVNEFSSLDTRIRYIKQTGIGMTENFTAVLTMAKGKYFLWLCDDDYISDNYLSETYDFLERNKDYSIACGTTRFFNKTGISNEKQDLLLEMRSAGTRVINYFKHVNSNILLYGLMRREEILHLIYPNIFAADLFWSSQVAFIGKCKILPNAFFYYSKHGISQNTSELSKYYSNSASLNNPYSAVKDFALKMILNKMGGFKNLSSLKAFFLAIKERRRDTTI